VNNYSRGNDFGTIKIFGHNFLVDNYSRGNDFATIKKFRPKIYRSKFLVDILFSRKLICTINNFRLEKFLVRTFGG
jgi:hypothetical protein